ncbi:hypothetical protein G7Y79_00020g049520 [Physcia stellaris]|nr:hypothetical protein G7Y79_00020g049520 [Physcia stellaris]
MNNQTPAYEYQLAHIDEDKGPQTVAATIVLIVVSSVAVALRLIAQRIVKASFTADDYCIFAALIIALALCGDLIASVHYGLGKHVLAVERNDPDLPRNIVNVFKTGYSMSILWIPDLFLIRISLLLFYRRVFATMVRRVRIAMWCVGLYVVLWFIPSLIVFIYQCDPIYFFWDRTYKLVGLDPPTEGTCLPSGRPTDLQLPFRLFDINSSGNCPLATPNVAVQEARVCGASIVKIYYVFAVDNSSDSTYHNTEILLWTIVECCIGLVCACIPCMTPLSRLVTVGPIAAFSSRKGKSAPFIVALENRKGGNNPKIRPPLGARRLPSVEDSRTALSPGGGVITLN